MDSYEGGVVQKQNEMHSVAVQANATESDFQLYAQKEVKKSNFQCQWPFGNLKLWLVDRFCLLRPLQTASLFVGRIA